MEALGLIDECNSTIGMAVSLLPEGKSFEEMREWLEKVQHNLFDLGAAVATPIAQATEKKREKTRFDEEATFQLEKWMDKMDEELPSLKNFILPGGHPSGANLHLARTVCRSAERQVVPLLQSGAVDSEALIYLNRLSDFLFTAARSVNHQAKIPETTWKH